MKAGREVFKMTKPIPATCDVGCKKTFKINKFRTKKVKNGIEKTYFRCSHCKHEYVAYYSSAETKKLQKEMRHLHVSMRGKAGTYEGRVLIQQETALKAKIKQSMDEARGIVERGR